MLLRLGYLTVSNMFTMLRLLPVGDRDGKFPDLFDTVLAEAGITVVLTGMRPVDGNSSTAP